MFSFVYLNSVGPRRHRHCESLKSNPKKKVNTAASRNQIHFDELKSIQRADCNARV